MRYNIINQMSALRRRLMPKETVIGKRWDYLIVDSLPLSIICTIVSYYSSGTLFSNSRLMNIPEKIVWIPRMERIMAIMAL
jgi:hypothetical protein